MVRITLELIRKRSEHNDGEISTLEEISLHQENIEKIELLGEVCRSLKILLMQNNLIGRIENLNKLKCLEYLNLALNNIEVIENLEGLESLKKLDLTVNFIGDLRSVHKLRYNEHLEQLFLTGNPCTDYTGYRDYVIASLPQLKSLDSTEITRSERITSLQRHAEVEGDVIRSHRMYAKMRSKQIRNYEQSEQNISDNDDDDEDDDANTKFWSSLSHHTPEDRIAIAKRTLKAAEKRNKTEKNKNERPYIPKFFSPEGRPYNINQPKLQFVLNDDSKDSITLEVSIYRYLDTSLVDVDVQPNYVRVTVKGKILQLTLPCQVQTDSSLANRNSVTGKLLVTMPRLNPLDVIKPRVHSSSKDVPNKCNVSKVVRSGAVSSTRELLEIGPPRDNLDFLKIYKDPKNPGKIVKKNSCAFEDNSEVPPLE